MFENAAIVFMSNKLVILTTAEFILRLKSLQFISSAPRGGRVPIGRVAWTRQPGTE
jgi:hypothetical protein